MAANLAARHNESVDEIYRPVRVNFPRRRTEILSIRDCIQLDLADMQLLANTNNGYRYFLMAVNPFSKRFYAEPLRTKSAIAVGDATKKILLGSGINFENIYTDRGTEFDNYYFKREIERAMGITHYYSYSTKKCAIVERAIGTVKRHLYKIMAKRGRKNWIVELAPLIRKINATKIARMGFAPNDVNAGNEAAIYQRFYATPRPFQVPKYRVGDRVRIAEPLTQFKKSCFPAWSVEVYTIRAVNRKAPNVYKIRDYYRNNLPGSYYAEELQICKHPGYFMIEEILERRGNRLRVRWLGYDGETGWVNARDVYDNRGNRGG